MAMTMGSAATLMGMPEPTCPHSDSVGPSPLGSSSRRAQRRGTMSRAWCTPYFFHGRRRWRVGATCGQPSCGSNQLRCLMSITTTLMATKMLLVSVKKTPHGV
uniref:Uncharacterized protein n=1 Tax=Opuntia streptacantha TaxID=393608 RepID=A0A7C9FJI5_OPUST